MDREYSCPHCKAVLNPNHTIMLVAACEDTRILIGFHPEPGNYEFHLPKGVRIEDSSVWTFHCPVCQEDLVLDESNLCVLNLKQQNETDHLLFSRIAGEHATFLVKEDGAKDEHGEHTSHYRELLAKRPFPFT